MSIYRPVSLFRLSLIWSDIRFEGTGRGRFIESSQSVCMAAEHLKLTGLY